MTEISIFNITEESSIKYLISEDVINNVKNAVNAKQK